MNPLKVIVEFFRRDSADDDTDESIGMITERQKAVEERLKRQRQRVEFLEQQARIMRRGG